MRVKILLLVIVAVISGVTKTRAQADTVISRYREFLFRKGEHVPENISVWMTTLNAQHQWPDIKYNDTEPANWKVSKHLERLAALAFAWAKPASPYYHDKALRRVIYAGLDHWLEKRYRNSNWWHNQIGVPQYMRDIIILLGQDLSPERRSKALEVMGQLQVQGSGAGANLVWSADLGFHYGALTRDKALMQKCRDLLVNEITVSTGEGIQPDRSYHQHGNRLQMYQYGRAFLLDNIRLAWQLRGTAMAFPDEKIDILSQFILKGWQWMARGMNTVPGTMDRSVSRQGELKSADMRYLTPFLCELFPLKAKAFKALEERQNGKGSLEGYRYYPYSDFSAYHQKNFSFFLKTISERTLPTESINNENLKGHLLHSGDGYLIRDGQEYYNLMPVWDWEFLPGVTGFKGADHIKRKSFAGGVSNGVSGLSVMDYHIAGKTAGSVSARKFWASHEGVIVCLIAGLQASEIAGIIYTALDQSRWQTEVTVNHTGNVLQEGIHHIKGVKWIHHNGFVYIPLTPATFDLHLKKATGSWSDINAAQSSTPVSEMIFMPVMLHEIPSEGKSTGYVLTSGKTSRKAQKVAHNPFWKVLRNDKECQAVSFEDGTILAAFFSPGKMNTGKKVSLQVDQPCLILIQNGKLWASDPSHKGRSLTILWDGRTYKVKLPENGFTSKLQAN